jgi:succinate dehydrogenase / fumarate reductase, iron-sulfur subunit
MTVLECLLAIQDEQDGSLAFRYSCRSAVCGSCAMCLNGSITLACKTQVQDIIVGSQILIEPLPNFEVLKDLVVDMKPFWDALERIEPWLHENGECPEKERLVSPKCMDKLDQYINCILCAACYGACKVLGRDKDSLGPAASAKLFRFIEDPRDARDLSFLDRFGDQQGVWGCDTLFRCVDACPKNVRPTDAIAGLRRKMVVHKMKRLLRLDR